MKFKEGDNVEVMRRKEDQFSWFPAKISFIHKSKCTVRYELFLTSDGKPVEETVHEEDVRPCPPPVNDKERWIVGDIAEVFDLYSWRVGKVVKVLKNDSVVIKLFGSIQLKEHRVSELRVLQSWQNNQWIMTDMRSSGKRFGYDCIHSSTNRAGNLDYGTSQGVGKRASAGQRSNQKHVSCNSRARTVKRNLYSHSGFSPVDLIGEMDKKRRSSADRFHMLTRRALPKKVEAVSLSKYMVTENFLHNSGKERIARYPQMNADKGYANNHVTNSSSIPLPVTEENNECSVASCSGNDHPGYTYQNLRKISKNTAFDSLDDAMSSCPLDGGKVYQSISGDDLAANVHDLELRAYQSTMQALHASGPLSWEQETLLTNLRLSLNISNEEHLVHLRHLLSA